MTTKNELSQILKSAREARGVSLQDAARVMSVRPQVLQDLEDGCFERMGALIYVKSYTKKYGKYLKIDPVELEGLLAKLEDPFVQNSASLIRAQLNEEKRMVHRSFFRWYAYILVILFGIGIGVYFVYGEKVSDIFHIKATPDRIINNYRENIKSPESINEASESIAVEESLPIKPVTEPIVFDANGQGEKIKKSIEPIIANVTPVTDTGSALTDFEVDQILRAGTVDLSKLNQDQHDLRTNDEENAQPPLAEGMSRLAITLGNADVWMQIKDKEQGILLNEVLPGNATYYVEGQSPLSLHIGNAQSIEKMVLNGDVVDEKVYRPNSRTTVVRVKLESKEES